MQAQKTKRISFHVPNDLVPIIEAIAEIEGYPPSKWIAEIIRKETNIARQRLLNPYPSDTKS